MRHWLPVIMLLFLATSASADSWLATRSDYYDHARVKMGQTVSETGLYSDTIASRFWNEAVTAILPVNRAIKKLTTITTSFKETTYELDTTLIDIEAVWIDSVGVIKTLQYLPARSWATVSVLPDHDNTANKTKFELTRPSYYDYTDSVLLVYPVSSQNVIDTLTILGWHRLADVDTVTDGTKIPERYRLSVLYHMVWNQAKARTDPRAEEFRGELVFALKQIGLKMTSEDKVVEAGK